MKKVGMNTKSVLKNCFSMIATFPTSSAEDSGNGVKHQSEVEKLVTVLAKKNGCLQSKNAHSSPASQSGTPARKSITAALNIVARVELASE